MIDSHELIEGDIFPTLNKRWYCLDDAGDCVSCIYFGTERDQRVLKQGRAYASELEACFYAEREKVKAKLEAYAKEHNNPIDWNDNSIKFSISAMNLKGNVRLIVSKTSCCRDEGVTYFSSLDICLAAMKEVGEDNIITFLFKGVDEWEE